jgi:hypothetical protein
MKNNETLWELYITSARKLPEELVYYNNKILHISNHICILTLPMDTTHTIV